MGEAGAKETSAAPAKVAEHSPAARHGSAAEPAVLALSGLAGNAALAAVLAPVVQRVAAPPALPAGSVPVVQREGGDVDKAEAIVKAVNLVNKSSLLKVKLPIKSSPGVKVFGALELKKIELELDIVGEASAPSLANKAAGTKVSAGAQNTKQSEVDRAKGTKTDAQATVYALEAETKFGSSPFAEMFSFKPGVEYGSYQPTNALTPNKQEFKGKLGLQIAAEGFSVEIQFIPVAYDRTKTGSDALKLGTFAAKVAKEFVHKVPGMFDVAGEKIDVAMKVKVTGTIEVGPDYDKIYKALPATMQKAFGEKAASAVAKEESERFVERMVKEIVADETKDIADPVARKAAKEVAERELQREVAKRELELALAEQTSIFVRRELVEKAGAELSIFAIRSKAQEFVKSATHVGPALRVMIKQGIKNAAEKASLKVLARKAVGALVVGPADFVLIGVEILYQYVDTLMKDMDLKELGLRAQAARDGYVLGYATGLRGTPAPGEGGGSGNLEGAAYLLGGKEGKQQFDKIVDAHVALHPEVSKPEAVTAITEIMASAGIDRSQVTAKAFPVLRDMMLKAYEKKYSGGILRALFGGDLKDSNDYKHFKSMIESHLQEGATDRIRARLKRKGSDKEVYVTLVMQDSTSDRARKFRTEDGRYMVRMGGDTKELSGWVTEDGKPLEDIYLTQEEADKTETPEAKAAQLAKMKSKLAAGTLTGSAAYTGLSFSLSGLELTGVPSNDLDFQEFMRSPDAQSMTVGQAGLKVSLDGSQRYDKEVTGEKATYTITFTVFGMATGPGFRNVRRDGSAWEMTSGWEAEAKAALKTALADKPLAALPKLV